MRYILRQKPQQSSEDCVIENLQKKLKLSKLTASLLCSRGISRMEEAEAFLNPSLEQLCDPFLFEDMLDAVSTVRHTISTKGKICIYGDYDADGISASAILCKTLLQMGAKVEVFLPNRMEHGYGLSMENIERLKNVSLLITVDCGITNVAEIARAKELGITTILTDHHECPHVLPKADYIINPKRPGERYPFDSLCGAGVAFKFAQALIGDAALEFLDIAALATIADIVPLFGENRTIAALGLKTLNDHPNAGLAALIKCACTKRTAELDAQTVSFVLAPRINAAGRIATAKIAFELLTEHGEARLEQLADELCALNSARQQKQEKVVMEAVQLYEAEQDDEDRIILLYSKDWDIGIVGLAASKIAERYTRPTVLLGESEQGVYTGSARSIPNLNIYDALNSQAGLFDKFGGHAGAAGLTIREEQLPKLRNRLNEYLKEHYTQDVFRPQKTYDLELEPAEASAALIHEFDRLRPFGCGNEQIELLIRGAQLKDCKSIGEDKHAKFRIEKHRHSLNAVAFGTRSVDVPGRADIVGTLNFNTFDMKPQMIVSAFSYDETLTQRLCKADTYLRGIEVPPQTERDKYFRNREQLLEIHVILKGISERKLSFSDEGRVLSFLQQYVTGITIEQAAFAFLVFEEIGLLEIKKNDRIHIVIRNGRRELTESRTYQKFFLGES